MSWTPPLGDAVDFIESGLGWTPPAGDAVDIIEGASAGPGGAARATLAWPITVAPVPSARAALAWPINVAAPARATLAWPVSVVSAAILGGLDGAGAWAAAPDGRWQAVVVLDGADISARIEGAVTVRIEDNAARTADFRFAPAGALQPMSLIGRPVRIAFAQPGGVNAQTLFTGVVDVPEIDLQSGLIACSCTDQAQEVWANTPRAAIDAIVGGRWHVAVSGEPEDNFRYLEERIQSVAASWALDEMQSPRVLAWATPTRSVTVRAADVVDGSLSITLPSRDQLRTRINVRLQYRYARLRQRMARAQYAQPVSFFIYSRVFNLYMRQPLLRSMVMDALERVSGWDLQGEIVTEHMAPGAYQSVELPTAPAIIISPDVAREYLLSFRARYATRWQQTVTEDYTVTLVCPELEALIGAEIPEELGASIESSFDVPGWATDWSIAPSLGDAADEAALAWEADGATQADRDEALRCLLDRAWVRLWSASRTGRVHFALPCRPDLWLDTAVALEHSEVRATGRIVAVTHTLDTASGTAISDVSVAVGMPGNTPAPPPLWSLPAAPSDAYVPPLDAYSFEIGTFVGGEPSSPPFDESTMIGFATNGVNAYTDAEAAAINWYPHQLSIRAPDLAAEDRDPRTLTSATTIHVAVPTDTLEVL